MGKRRIHRLSWPGTSGPDAAADHILPRLAVRVLP